MQDPVCGFGMGIAATAISVADRSRFDTIRASINFVIFTIDLIVFDQINLYLVVSGDKPHACELCTKKFALACNLRAHMKTHEGN